MTAANEEQFIFELAGEKIPLYDFTVEEYISDHFEIHVTLASEESLSPDESIGQKGLLTIKSEHGDRFFHGLVRCFEQASNKGKYQMYSLQLVPDLWLTSLIKNIRIFQNLKTEDIIKKVLKDSGITSDLFRFNLTKAYAEREYCVQYRETNYQFINRILAEEGIYYYFEHKKSGHKLIFADGTPTYKPIPGESTLQFNQAGALVDKQKEYVTRVNKLTSIKSGKVTLADYNFKNPSFKLESVETSDKDQKLEIYDYPGHFDKSVLGKHFSKVKLEESRMNSQTITGGGLVPGFVPGFTFSLTYHPTDSFNSDYLLTQVIHSGVQSQTLQEIMDVSEGTHYENSFTCIPSNINFRPETAASKPSVEGIQTAVVTGPKGEEIYTDSYGRIKVQFHWDREGKKNEKTSCWMRVSQKSAGPGWGSVFIPRIGQEVIVDFIDGDPDRPIVTGCIYHEANKPPYTLPDEKTKSTIRTESSPGGGGYNEIRFEDKKGEEELYIQAEKDRNELVKNDMTTTIDHDRSLTVKNNRTTEISGGNESLTVKSGSRNVSVKGEESHKSQANFKHDVTGNYDLKVGGNFNVKVSGVVTINGSQIHLNP